MADINQITYSHAELVEMLLKQAGIHDGHWSLMVSLVMNVGGFHGPEGGILPGAAVLIQKIGLQRHLGEIEKGAVVVDAAKVNPKRGTA